MPMGNTGIGTGAVHPPAATHPPSADNGSGGCPAPVYSGTSVSHNVLHRVGIIRVRDNNLL